MDGAVIIAIDPQHDGAHVILQCERCDHSFTVIQTIVAGMPVGTYTCANCKQPISIFPDDFFRALELLWPEHSVEEYEELLSEASRVAHCWTNHPAIADLLTYEGINLGALTHFTSYKIIAKGLVQIRQQNESGRVATSVE